MGYAPSEAAAASAIKLNKAGVTDASSAAAGEIGELISSLVASGSAISLSTGVAANITFIDLTAGDWDVDAVGVFNLGATTNITYGTAGISIVSATRPTTFEDEAFIQTGTSGVSGNTPTCRPGPRRINVSSTTRVYLVGFSAFTVSTCAVFGRIRARRVR